jgi:hypothetical protein
VGKEYWHREKSEEKPEEWRKLHNEELTDLYFSPNNIQNDKIKKNEMGEARSAYGG